MSNDVPGSVNSMDLTDKAKFLGFLLDQPDGFRRALWSAAGLSCLEYNAASNEIFRSRLKIKNSGKLITLPDGWPRGDELDVADFIKGENLVEGSKWNVSAQRSKVVEAYRIGGLDESTAQRPSLRYSSTTLARTLTGAVSRRSVKLSGPLFLEPRTAVGVSSGS